MQFGKRAVFRPSPIPFLIAGHRSLFKVSNGWRIDQHWSEGRAGGGRGMDKRVLSERDICTKFITPALRQAGWDEMLQIREEVSQGSDHRSRQAGDTRQGLTGRLHPLFQAEHPAGADRGEGQ
jgi:hypothetical protein